MKKDLSESGQRELFFIYIYKVTFAFPIPQGIFQPP